jgi:hypothetical protein
MKVKRKKAQGNRNCSSKKQEPLPTELLLSLTIEKRAKVN